MCDSFLTLSMSVNDRLTWRFLDLRDGAKLVVLKPFWPIKRPLTERTVPHFLSLSLFECILTARELG